MPQTFTVSERDHRKPRHHYSGNYWNMVKTTLMCMILMRCLRIGESGIDGTKLLPEPTVLPQPGNAIKAMYDAIMSTPYQTCAVCQNTLKWIQLGGEGLTV